MNYGRKEDFQQIRNMGVAMNGAIIIFRAGEITLAEKVSSVCSKAWLDLAAGSYASYSEAQRCVFLHVYRTRVCRIVLQAWSCSFALKLHVQVWTLRLGIACYCWWCRSSWPPAVCWNNQASGVVGLGGSLGAELANITGYIHKAARSMTALPPGHLLLL